MVDPVRTLLDDVERALAAWPGVKLAGPSTAEARRKVEAALGSPLCPGADAFYQKHDGGDLPGGARILSLDDALTARADLARSEPLRGLLPVLVRGDVRFALDPEAAGGDEWPVVEVIGRGVERRASSLLRFLHVLAAEASMPALAGADGETAPPTRPADVASALAMARLRLGRDPFMASHWVEVAELEDRSGRPEVAESVLESGLRTAVPATAEILAALALRRLTRGAEGVMPMLEDALEVEPLTLRDDDARLDAAALLHLLATDTGNAEQAARARGHLGEALPSTLSYWRLEAVAAAAARDPARARIALRLVRGLDADDKDIDRLTAALAAPGKAPALDALWAAREALDVGRADDAERRAREAVRDLPELGLGHALLAEALNAGRKAGAVAAAQRAVELNPSLIEAWRELGEAWLEADKPKEAEAAWKAVIERDPAFGPAHAKLAQVYFEQRRNIEALEALEAAEERGADPFFVSALRGDLYAEMQRHEDAAEAYDTALMHSPDDHWALHQAAVEHGRCNHGHRASQLFELAIKHDTDGCAQTFVDYGDLLRRIGRIGDAVKMYRRAVKAVPEDPDWRETLRDAEKELAAAPN